MQKSLAIMDSTGAEAGAYALKSEWLESEKGDQAVHDVVVAFLAKQRRGTASTKRRGEVSGGGAKPWRQKGTGRARAGSNRSPIWRHGGITFGPLPRSYAKCVNRSVRRLALKRTFTERLAENAVVIVDKIELAEAKTRRMLEFLKTIGAGSDALVVMDEENEAVMRAAGNLPDVTVMRSSAVNPYWLLLFKKVVFTRTALDRFVKRLSAAEAEAEAEVEA